MRKWRCSLRGFCREDWNIRNVGRNGIIFLQRDTPQMPIGGTNVIQTFRVWLNADQQLNEGVTRIELKWKVYNQPRWPSDDDDDEGLLKAVVREKSPKARCESLKGTGFGVGAPSFGASAANFGWMLALLYKSSSTSLNSPMSPSFSLLHSLVPRQKRRWWEMSPTVTRQLLIILLITIKSFHIAR